MTKDQAKRIHTVFGVFLSITIIIAGICLMAGCIGIYRSGDHPFSPEAVAAAFSRIAVPVYLCLAAVIAGFVLEGFLPPESKKLTVERQAALILRRLHAKTDLSQCAESIRSGVLSEQKSRKLHRLVTAALLILGSIVFLAYALNGSNFHRSEINSSMIRAMYVLIPCMAIPFGYAVFTAYHSRASMEREIALLKQADSPAAPAQKLSPPSGSKLCILRNVLLVAAVALLVYGFCTGGTVDVLTKAVNICTECVGLG